MVFIIKVYSTRNSDRRIFVNIQVHLPLLIYNVNSGNFENKIESEIQITVFKNVEFVYRLPPPKHTTL